MTDPMPTADILKGVYVFYKPNIKSNLFKLDLLVGFKKKFEFRFKIYIIITM